MKPVMGKDDGRLREEMALGSRARQLMADELMVGAFDKLRAGYAEQWAYCGNPELRDRLWLKTQALNDVQADLTTMIETGKMAAIQLAAAPQPRLDA